MFIIRVSLQEKSLLVLICSFAFRDPAICGRGQSTGPSPNLEVSSTPISHLGLCSAPSRPPPGAVLSQGLCQAPGRRVRKGGPALQELAVLGLREMGQQLREKVSVVTAKLQPLSLLQRLGLCRSRVTTRRCVTEPCPFSSSSIAAIAHSPNFLGSRETSYGGRTVSALRTRALSPNCLLRLDL